MTLRQLFFFGRKSRRFVRAHRVLSNGIACCSCFNFHTYYSFDARCETLHYFA